MPKPRVYSTKGTVKLIDEDGKCIQKRRYCNRHERGKIIKTWKINYSFHIYKYAIQFVPDIDKLLDYLCEENIRKENLNASKNKPVFQDGWDKWFW